MIQRIFTALQLRHLTLGLLFVCFGFSTNAQVSIIPTNNSSQWKDRAVMEQIIQQELTETNASLTLPNLTDWSTAMLEAYRIFLYPHSLLYTFTDNCGNTTTCSFDLTVLDLDPPTPVADQSTTISLGGDDPFDCYFPSADGCQFAGVAYLKASNLM